MTHNTFPPRNTMVETGAPLLGDGVVYTTDRALTPKQIDAVRKEFYERCTRPYYLRPAPVPPARHTRESAWRQIASGIINACAWLIVMAACGIAFYLFVTPALPVLIPVLDRTLKPLPEKPAPVLGRNL